MSRKQIGCVRIRPFGRRIEKSSSAGTSIYAYDGDNLVEETNFSGAVVARYSQGLNIDEPLAMLRSGATDFYEADGLGSVTSLTSTAGALAQTYTFDSFGKQTASSGSLTNPFQYTGREFDPETSLYYYRARYYDPSTGRFLSEDSGDQSSNLYAYVENGPTNLVDPLGLYITPRYVPAPSPALDKLLTCLDGCIKVPVFVTATTNGRHADRGHALGASVDIAPPAGLQADTVFCCAGKCGAVRGLNEAPAQGGQRLPTTTGPNYHFSLVQYVKHPTTKSAIPPGCKPGRCSNSNSGSHASGGGLGSSFWGWLNLKFIWQ